MKKACLKIAVIILIISLILQSLVPASYAMDIRDEGWILEAQQRAVADYAQKFVKEGNEKKILLYSQNTFDRIKGYNFEVTSNEYGQYNGTQNNGAPFTNMLVYDSASLMATIYKRTLYMQLTANANSRDNVYTVESFLEDARNRGYYNNFGFIAGDKAYSYEELMSLVNAGRLRPGDLIVYEDESHMLMYIGTNADLLYDEYKMTSAEVELLRDDGIVTGQKITVDLPNPHYYIHALNPETNITISALELLPYADEIDTDERTYMNYYILRPKKTVSNMITDDMEIDMDIVWPDNTYSAYTKVGTDIVTGRNYEYYYIGTPSTGEYSLAVEQEGGIYEWLVRTIEELMSWLAGFISIGFRTLIVGWTSQFERIISDAVQATGKVQRETKKIVNGNEYEYVSSDILNIEDIVYNRVPLLDANIFENSTIAGSGIRGRMSDEEIEDLRKRVATGDPQAVQELRDYLGSILSTMSEPELTDIEEQAIKNSDNAWERLKEYRDTENVILTIRRTVAGIYLIIRNIAIIGLLVTLIYIGIRMAISSIAEQRAKYKKMLLNWCVSLIIVFTIHYLMVFILQINQTLIDTMEHLGQGVSFYETFKVMAYEFSFTDGWIGAILYVYLLILLIKFLWIYIKRFFTLCILTIIAPVIGIGYAIDKIKDNKSQSLSNWIRNYVFNVIIQFVHAGLYTVLMTIVYGLLSGKHNFGAAILAFVFLNFITNAPKIIEHIFGIKAATLKDTLEDIGTGLASFAAITGLVKMQTRLYSRPLKIFGKAANTVTNNIRYEHYKPLDYSQFDDIDDEDERRAKIAQAQKEAERQEAARKAKIKEDMARRKQYTDEQIAYAKNIGNMGKALVTGVASVPSMVLSPKAGMAMLLSSKNSYSKSKQAVQNMQSKILGYDVDKFER